MDEIRTTNLPDGLIVDLGSSETPLPPSVFVNGQPYMPVDNSVPRTWSLPPEPGPEVTAVRDQFGEIWTRGTGYFAGHWVRVKSRPIIGMDTESWVRLLRDRGLLTDVTAEVQQ